MESGHKPSWLKVRLPQGDNFKRVREVLKSLRLAAVCQDARCPNIGECWGGGTATIMILGEVCTRACRFCAVKTGNPRGMVDELEPLRVAQAVKTLKWRYVVLTSVDRDDLPDGGASIFAKTIRTIREMSPSTLVEALIPDFRGNEEALKKVVDAGPTVLGHNIETVRRLTPKVRDKRASYDLSLQVLKCAKEFSSDILTKSSIMVGLGEEEEEIIETMRDLREVEVDILTIGQYLKPTKDKRHLPVVRYVTPEEFKKYREIGLKLGFLYVASGPLVRSSYRAGEFFIEALKSEVKSE
jgi:lipoic acid synthetase